MSQPVLVSKERIEMLLERVGPLNAYDLRGHIMALEEQLQAARAALKTAQRALRVRLHPLTCAVCGAEFLAPFCPQHDPRPATNGADPLTPADRLELADMLAQFRRIKDSDKLERLESALRGGR